MMNPSQPHGLQVSSEPAENIGNGPTSLQTAIAAKLESRASSKALRKLSIVPADAVDFSSNDFLSLATSPTLHNLFLHELHHGPASTNLGSGGSRLLDGNSVYAEKLEHDIANFHNADAALLCNSGFDANVGLFSALPQPGDVIVYDAYIHASVHDGMRLSRAERTIAFDHNSISSLRKVLVSCLNDPAVASGRMNVFVAVEAVYSMDGDMAPLVSIVNLLKTLFPHRNAHLIVDEAHSTGIFGSKGSGLVCELGLEQDVLVRLCTFGKALACNGAVLLCQQLVKEYLVNYARPLIYTTFLSYPALAAIRASYTFLQSGTRDALADNVKNLGAHLQSRLEDLQCKFMSQVQISSRRAAISSQNLLRVPRRTSTSPIFYVLSSDPEALAAHCQAKGYTVRGIVAPTVPRGGERVRICLHAGNTIAQIDGLIDAIDEWVRARLCEAASTTTTITQMTSEIVQKARL